MNNIFRFKKIAAILKSAFINEAHILIDINTDSIELFLIGMFSFGKQRLGGAIYRLQGDLTFYSEPEKSIWVQHKGIDSSAYMGLGYANDLMSAGISEVEKNNGIVISMGSVTPEAQTHNLKALNAGFKTKVVVLWNDNIWDNPEDLILEFPNGESFRDQILSLFLEPYLVRNIDNNHRRYMIESGLMISQGSARCSIPVLQMPKYEDWSERLYNLDPASYYYSRPGLKNEGAKIKEELRRREDAVRSIRGIKKNLREIKSEASEELYLLDNEINELKRSLMITKNNDLEIKLNKLLARKKELEDIYYSHE